MRQLIFLLGSYHPNYSAVGYCAHQVIKCLKSEFDITVVALRNDPLLPLEENHDGVRILRIESEDIKQRNKIQTSKNKLSTFFLNFIRARGLLRRLLSTETVDRSLVRAYFDCLTKQPFENHTIVPVVFPIETVLAALQYKKIKPKTKIIPYLFDDFVDSGSLHIFRIAGWLKRNRHLQLEKEMLEDCNLILCMHQLRNHFETHFPSNLVSKIKFLEHPLLLRRNINKTTNDDGITRLCFTGSLIRNVREPDYLIELLRNTNFNKKVYADFFAMGNAATRIKNDNLNNLVQIVNHGRVSKEEADAAVAKADILINIGEKKGRQVSSKIFEYMSTGKPIIHLSYIHNDIVSEIIKRYPNSLILIMDKKKITTNAHKLNIFALKCTRKNIDFEIVCSIFPDATPEKTSSAIRDFA